MESVSSPITLPPVLAEAVSGYTWQQINLGLSPSKVFRLEAKNKASFYLKIAPRIPGFSLFQEKLILDWVVNRLPVAEARLFDRDEMLDYLLLSEIPGLPASDDSLKGDISRIIGQLVEGLKLIHALSVQDCPFDQRINYKIALVRERVTKNLIDEEDFDEERRGKMPEELFEQLLLNGLPDEDLVFTHGDYCVPNVILENGGLSGFVDWGNAGISDRYQDLALLSRSVSYNFGKKWEMSVFEIYGIEPDWKKINFYRLLDEFF